MANGCSNVSFPGPTNPADPRYTFRYFGLTIGFYAIFVGIIGNALTILIYISNKKLRTTFNTLLLNLAIVDFITASLMLPFNVAGYVQLKWPFGNDSFTAQLQAFNYFCCGYSSIVFLVTITVNRFVGVMFPNRYTAIFRKDRMVIVLVLCWLIAPAFLLPFLVGSHSSCKTVGGRLTGYRESQLLCTFVCLPTNGWNEYMQFTRVLFQFLPLVIMIVFYTVIFVTVHGKREELNQKMKKGSAIWFLTRISESKVRHPVITRSWEYWIKDVTYPVNQVRNRAESSESPLQARASKPKLKKTDTSMSLKLSKRRQEDRRMLIISVTLCVGFMVTFLPSVIVNLIPREYKKCMDPRWDMVASNLSWFNCSINPIIYVILNGRFRKEYWRVIRLLVGSLHERFVKDESTTNAVSVNISVTNNDSVRNA